MSAGRQRTIVIGNAKGSKLRPSTRAISSFSAIPPLESQSTQSRLLEDLNLEVTRIADCRFQSRLSPVGRSPVSPAVASDRRAQVGLACVRQEPVTGLRQFTTKSTYCCVKQK